MHAVVTGNSIGCVHHKVGEGTIRTSRVRYVCDGGALYIPAWPGVESWYAARLPALECHISELDWNSCWRCVRLRGQVTPLHPTGAPREREAWRQGVSALRRAITDLAPIEDLALANFGVVQIDIEFWEGTVVLWDEVPESNAMYTNTVQVADSPPPASSSWASWLPKVPDLLMAMILVANEFMSVNAGWFDQVALTAGTGS